MTKRDAKDEKKAPKLRFKGFTDDWEHGHLGDIVKIVMGQSPSSINYTDNPEDHILVQGNADLENGHVVPRVWTKQVTKTADKDDIILSVRAPVGDVGITNYPIVIGRGVAAIKGNKFIYQLLDKMNQDSFWRKYSTGSTFESINSNDLKKAEIFHPNEPEQEKIGKLFQSLDRAIYLHEEKQKQLEQLKKALLQKMFVDKTGYPELRFNSFNKPWEQVKLGAIYRKIRNAFVGTATPFYVSKGHFYLESNNVKEGKINTDSQKFINDTFYIKQRNKWLHTGDIVMVQSGDVGQSAVIPPELNNSAAHALIMFQEPKMNVDPRFLNVQFQGTRSKKQIGNITKGNTIKHILASDMQKFVVLFPDIEEQQSIGQLFQILDHIITLHTKKIEELKQLKQALLQQMFI